MSEEKIESVRIIISFVYAECMGVGLIIIIGRKAILLKAFRFISRERIDGVLRQVTDERGLQILDSISINSKYFSKRTGAEREKKRRNNLDDV